MNTIIEALKWISCLCRTMIPSVRRLAVQCADLTLCVSCMVALSFVTLVGPVSLQSSSLWFLANAQSAVKASYWYMTKEKPDSSSDPAEGKAMFSLSKIDPSEGWQPKTSSLLQVLPHRPGLLDGRRSFEWWHDVAACSPGVEQQAQVRIAMWMSYPVA